MVAGVEKSGKSLDPKWPRAMPRAIMGILFPRLTGALSRGPPNPTRTRAGRDVPRGILPLHHIPYPGTGKTGPPLLP